MDLNNKIDIIQEQKLVMTTQLKQSLEILNMSTLELEEKVKKEVEENPLLEIEKRIKVERDNSIKSFYGKNYNREEYNLSHDINLENIIKYEHTLYDYLKFQLGTFKIDKNERKVCEYIIDCLDNNGYLSCSEKVIIDKLNITCDNFKKCLKYVQQLEPSGIGARDLKECLLIQMKNQNIKNDIIKSIILKDLNLIGENKIKLISKKYNISLEECVKYIEIIRNFNPKPSRLYNNDKSIYIHPDVIVEKLNNKFVISINDSFNFHLYINNYYKNILNNNSTDENTKKFIKNKLNCALNLLKNIDGRKNTILKITEAILREQKEFFYNGEKYIKPMKLKDISIELGCHESTISRGINNKYMLTPCGLFKFKDFFSTSISSKDNQGISSTKVKKMIKEFIDKEDKLKPLSDNKICKLLAQKGIIVARRTVAKYREEMNILSSSKRKQFI